MNKKIFWILFLLSLFFAPVFSADIEIPVNPNAPSIPPADQIQQAQATIEAIGRIQTSIEGLSKHIDDRTNVLGGFVKEQLDATTSNLIVITIIINICTIGIVLGIILYLKSLRRWN